MFCGPLLRDFLAVKKYPTGYAVLEGLNVSQGRSLD